MKKILLFSLILNFMFVLMTGCISSSPRKKYFQLHIEESRKDVALLENIKQLDKIILIEDVEVEDIYNDYRVVYRTSPYQLNYYSYNFWIKKPGKLIRDSIYDYLSTKNFFAKVILSFVEGEPHYLLKARVEVLEEYDLKAVWYARLKMEIHIKDFKSGKTILFHRFDKRKRLAEKKVEKVPAAVSTIIKGELVHVVKELHSTINKQEIRN